MLLFECDRPLTVITTLTCEVTGFSRIWKLEGNLELFAVDRLYQRSLGVSSDTPAASPTSIVRFTGGSPRYGH